MIEKKKVAIVMGSESDFPIVKKAAEVLKEFAHRSPDQAAGFAANAALNGFGAIIAAAGKAAHLAGAMAANTVLPVIGLPIKASALEGMDALLATVQMPAGVPVATVAIDGAANAAYLAIQILGVYDQDLRKKLIEFKKEQTASSIKSDARIAKLLNQI